MAELITNIINAIAVYVLFWWIVLFAVLPWGIRSHASHASRDNKQFPAAVGLEGSAGTDSTISAETGVDQGSPVVVNIPRKLIVTSVLALVLFCFYFLLVSVVDVARYDVLDIHRWLGISVPDFISRPNASL